MFKPFFFFLLVKSTILVCLVLSPSIFVMISWGCVQCLGSAVRGKRLQCCLSARSALSSFWFVSHHVLWVIKTSYRLHWTFQILSVIVDLELACHTHLLDWVSSRTWNCPSADHIDIVWIPDACMLCNGNLANPMALKNSEGYKSILSSWWEL